jgi:hypothetical protein
VFFPWYNDEHHHSGLGYLTPAMVHYRIAEAVRDQRMAVLAGAGESFNFLSTESEPGAENTPTIEFADDWKSMSVN